MKPQKTIYNGIEFKSALEARWAYHFDLGGLRWQYEPNKRISVNGSAYTFDFVLSIGYKKMFIEVKPTWEEYQRNEKQRSARWSVMAEMVNDINNVFYLICGYPGYTPTFYNLLPGGFDFPINRGTMDVFYKSLAEAYRKSGARDFVSFKFNTSKCGEQMVGIRYGFNCN